MPSPFSLFTSAKRVVRKVRKTAPIEWRAYTRRLPVEPDVVLYESFAGNGMLCNPEAIFRALLADPEQQHLTHVWALRDLRGANAPVVKEFAGDDRVRFVKYRSPSYYKVLATAGLLFNNASFPADFVKREGQTYVNTWHGTPLKVMGFDEPDGSVASRNVIRNLVAADYLLSASDYMSEVMWEGAYRLHNVFRGKIVQEGYPRTDRQHVDEAGRERLRQRLREAGVSVDGRRTVLYAPTWRGESFYEPTNDALLLGNRVRQLKEALGDDVQVLLKVHQQVYAFAAAHGELRPVLVPNHLPTNEVLALADVLVSDYSSIFFDHLSTGRPVVFFTPDLDDYSDSRGLYLDVKELPGPSARTIPEVARLIQAIGTGGDDDPLVTHGDRYAAARERFAPLDDGNATQRVLDVVVRGKLEGRNVRETRKDGRETLLVFLGGMRPNGITTSALNLLHNIDRERFDVSVVYDFSRNPARKANADAIPADVRRFARIGTFAPGKLHRRRRRELMERGTSMAPADFEVMRTLLQGEWRRMLGDTRFDYVVDFSGYSPFWSFLLSNAPAGSRSIWLHNDLRADQLREVDGKRPHFDNLGSVFSSYRFYDHLVSVSDSLNEINRANLANEAPAERFTWARNTINHEHILRKAHGDVEAHEHVSADPSLSALSFDVPSAVMEIAEAVGLESVREEIERRLAIATVVPPREGVKTFVSVGRLSPEKNHERLIRAFDLVHQENPDTRLVIIGSGPLEASLDALTRRLGLAQAVTFAGQQPNPWAIMAKSDYFVLSSDYEGQPMVILEARVLGLPVITTAFDSVGGALPPGVGLIVPRDHRDLADGMRKALAGEVPNPEFDPVAYNREAVADFCRAIGADPA